MTQSWKWSSIAALLAAAACGSDPAPASGPGSGGAGAALGTLAGNSFTAGSAAFFTYRLAPNAPLTTQIVISDRPDLCKLIKDGQATAPSGELKFFSLLLQPQAGEIAPGSYSVGAQAGYLALAAAGAGPICAPSFQSDADAGSLSLTALAPGPGGHAAGSFDVAFPEGRLSGRFDAAFCDAAITSFKPCGR